MTAFNRSDHQILQALQANAHRSDAALGDQIGLSESAVRRHRHRLEADGFVQGYVALVDQRRLGYRETVFVTVMLEAQAQGDVFENEVRTMPEVMACYAVAGEEDYLLRVVARDVGHFDRFWVESPECQPSGMYTRMWCCTRSSTSWCCRRRSATDSQRSRNRPTRLPTRSLRLQRLEESAKAVATGIQSDLFPSESNKNSRHPPRDLRYGQLHGCTQRRPRWARSSNTSPTRLWPRLWRSC